MSRLTRMAPLAALILMAAPLAAQDPQPPYGPGGRLMQGITLNERQQLRVDSLRREHQLQLREMERNRVRTAAGDSAYVRERAQLRERQMTQARGVLTPEQQQTFDRNRDQLRDQLRTMDRDQLREMDRARTQAQDQMRQGQPSGAGQPGAGQPGAGQGAPQGGAPPKPSTGPGPTANPATPAGPGTPQGSGAGTATGTNRPK